MAAHAHRLGFAVKLLGDGGARSSTASTRSTSACTGWRPRSRPTRATRTCRSSTARWRSAPTSKRDIRVSTHPGQYTVLNSERDDTRAAAGGAQEALSRFKAGFERLSERARARLVIENDDRTFGLADVLTLAGRTGLRVVFDLLHHHCHDPERIPDHEALALALATWPPDQLPKVHYSSARLDIEERRARVGRRVETRRVLPQLRAHADLVDPFAFERFLHMGPHDFDAMLEAKAEDLALLRLRDQLAARGLPWRDGRVLVERASR